MSINVILADDHSLYLEGLILLLKSNNNISILGENYANIRVFYQDAFTSPTSFVPIRGYWARDIGLIRKETSDGRVWLLESYQIVR